PPRESRRQVHAAHDRRPDRPAAHRRPHEHRRQGRAAGVRRRLEAVRRAHHPRDDRARRAVAVLPALLRSAAVTHQDETGGGGCSGCGDAATSRRGMLAGAGRAALAALAAPLLIPRVAFARGSGGGQDVLVNVFLRGGMDGLTLCPPYGDSNLYTARPTLAVAKPGGGSLAAYDLD